MIVEQGDVRRPYLVGIVDSQSSRQRQLSESVLKGGYRTITGSDQGDVIAMMERVPNVMIIRDGLPGIDTCNVVSKLRESSFVLVMVIGSDRETDHILQIYNAGADLYLNQRELTPRILVSRIQAQLRGQVWRGQIQAPG